ncbi:MAG: cell wall hydrolase [Roseburia sp.]|nr:cell wall hydrolase [Roseburia sp.]
MSLKRRAVSGVIIAGSLVIMCATADAADTVMGEEVIQAVAEVSVAANGTAGVVAVLNEVQADALSSIEQTSLGIEQVRVDVVASAELTEEEDTELEQLLSGEAFAGNETGQQKDAGNDKKLADLVEAVETEAAETEEETAEAVVAGTEKETAEVVAAGTEKEKSEEAAAGTEKAPVETVAAGTEKEKSEEAAGAEKETAEVVAAGETEDTDNEEWQNRLMADVDEFLYVRAGGDENAEIVGKLYNGAVAEIVEVGDTWTHIVSGNVDGYVKNDYCVTGEDAFAYAVENVETQAEIQTDGLRVRSEADENGKVLTAVSTGTTLTVDTEAETDDKWVAVKYGDSTAYVSADYVTTDLALGEAVTIEEEKAALAKKAAEEAKAAQVTGTQTVQKESVAASVDEVTLLAALIQCEAGNESYEGQLAVGAVVMNRVRSGRYPGSVSGVIYDAGQFTPAATGAVASVAANGPKASCIQAAQEALAGADNTGGATCFRRASSGMAGVVIGNHVFF